MKPDILARDKAGYPVSIKEPDYPAIRELIEQAQRTIAEMNTGYQDKAQMQALFSKLTGKTVHESFDLLPPFYTDFGKNISVGKRVFINHCCEFMDRGGITIEDDVFIGPKVNLITINHDTNPYQRYITICKPIHICSRVWIGAGVTVMPGVTIGENAIVSGGAVVTKDVPPGTIAAGVPARTLRELRAEELTPPEDMRKA